MHAIEISNHPPVRRENLEELAGLHAYLGQRIRGQDQVLPRIVSVLNRGEMGLAKAGRPKGSFLLLGPTGVGKTEITLGFTNYLMGPGHLFRFDMSEYQNQESLGLLLGARVGERGTLGIACEKMKRGTLLFDEIEKAHPRILDIFLQIVDAARVTVADGETLDLSGFYVVFTSNIGSADILSLQNAPYTTMERHVLTRAQQTLRPEMYARISEKLVFNRLTYEVQLEIAEMLLAAELKFLASKGCALSADKSVFGFLVRHGYSTRFGARPMRDAVEKYIGDAVTTDIFAGRTGAGKLVADGELNRLVVT